MTLVQLTSLFFKIKVKRLRYRGMPAIAIFLRDQTKKMKVSLENKKYREEKLRATQAESYSAMISHEMVTPLGSIIFFFKYIDTYLQSIDDD